jgi:hypothetical protein
MRIMSSPASNPTGSDRLGTKAGALASRRKGPAFERQKEAGPLAVGLNVIPGNRVQFDQETWNALDLLARDSMRDFHELADEAFADRLHKHGRPVKKCRRDREAPTGTIGPAPPSGDDPTAASATCPAAACSSAVTFRIMLYSKYARGEARWQ